MISLLVIIYITFIMLGLPNSLLGSAWPAMHEQFSVPLANAGIISLIISGGTIFSTMWCDVAVKRLGSRLLILFSLMGIATSLLGFFLANHFIWLCLWSIPLGFSLGFIDATLNNVVATHYQARHMNWLHAFWGVGAFIGPLVMSFFLARGSWVAGYRFIFVVQIAFIAVFLVTFRWWKKIQGTAVEEKQGEIETFPKMQLFRLPGVKQSLLVFFCYCAIEATMGLWAASYLVTVRGLADGTAALWVSLYFLGITVGRFAAGFLTMKLNRRGLIRLSIALIGAGIIVFLLPIPSSLLIVGLFLIGLGCAPIFPILIHETPDNFGAKYSQGIIGMQMSFAYIGTTLMPPLFGVLAEHTGHYVFPFFLAIFLILMALMIRLLYKKVGRIKEIAL
ncbi:MAG: MFS transporter [Lachnospiraceae bacterium]|nr:MFS transporter [Lachnospiraceae bacterium]